MHRCLKMGGSAFSTHSPPLPTPRMPLHIYNLILSQTLSVLRTHFLHAASPIEAPEKPDYGDIDILLFSPLTPEYDPAITPKTKVTEALAKDLRAKAWISGKSGQATNLAIPWPKENSGVEEENYIQVDIHILPTLKDLKWHLFHAAHGDLWNILGSTIRRFGLTVNNLGLFLRIPSIELFDRKKSMIFLTDESSSILNFIGLDPETWWKPFETREQMFEYAASCRLFWIKPEVEEGEMEGDVVGELGVGMEGLEGGEEGKKKLKHNDRQRMSKRPIFRAWMDEFIPRCRAEGRFLEMKASREQVRDDAFEKFGVKAEFQRKEKEWKVEKHKDEMWKSVIKGSVPSESVDPQFKSASIKTLKSVLMEGGLWDGIVPRAAERDEEGFWDKEEVERFVRENWEEAGRLGMEDQKRRAAESMRVKAEKKAILAEQEGKDRGVLTL